MNHSLYGADRTTHLRIVIVALTAATVVACVGIASHVGSEATAQARVIRAGAPIVLTSSTSSVMR